MNIYYLDHPEHGTHICYNLTDIPALEKAGWVIRKENEDTSELDELKAKADALGIEYHHKAGVNKLKELIEAKESE